MHKLKVGIDARLLSRPLSGIGQYTLKMCQALSKIENISLYLYSPSPIPADVVCKLSVENIRTANFNNGVLRQFWTECHLPLWAKKDGVDVFWGPAHRLPRWLPNSIASAVTIHDLVWKYAGETMRPLSRFLERYQMPAAVSSADHVIAISNATAVAVKKELGIKSDKLSIVLLGANVTEKTVPFRPLEQLDINHPYFLFVGTLEPRKNLPRLLTAYSYLANSLKDQAMLVIAGGKGWGGIDINHTVADLGLEKYVRILGFVDETTLTSLYANALFLAMPSLYEGFGLPLVEAMAHGTPVLTSNNSSMPEVAGNAGLLIDPLDTHSIKNGLEELIINHDLRRNLADNSRDNIARFNWDTAAEQLISVFQKAISTRANQHS
ncbi:MAG: glycosyltransferase family 1 protein [Oceanospirillaceae bacterium]